MAHFIENKDRTLTSLLEQIQDQAARSADYLAPTNQLQFETVETESAENKSRIVIEANKGMPTTTLQVNDVAFDQIAARADLPAKTARRLRDEYPDVLDHAVRRIWDQENETRMVRAYMNDSNFSSVDTGMARAFVSDRFKTFDNVHLIESALPELINSDAQWRVVTGQVTDKRMYLQFKSEVIQGEPRVGDRMANGIRLSNSEVGHGSLSVIQLVWTLACLNGMQTQNLFRKAHLGQKAQDSEFAELLRAETIEKSNEALAMQMQDIVKAFASRESFDQVISKMAEAHSREVQGSPQQAVENLGEVLKLTKAETSSVLDGLLDTMQQSGYTGTTINQATLVNAVTAVQHKVDADSAGDWQRLGAKVLDLNARQWDRVALAA